MKSLISLSALILTLPVFGQSILVDLGSASSYRGVSVSNPSNGNHWNSVDSSAYFTDLVDTTGTPTTLDFGFVTSGGTDFFNGPAGGTEGVANAEFNAAALGELGAAEAVYDYFTNSVFVINQMDPSVTYTLTLYGSHKFNTDSTTVYTVYGANPTDVQNSGGASVLASASLDVWKVNAWEHNQDTVATITGLSGLSQIHVGFVGSAGDSGYLNAFALSAVAVPEPATYGLLGGFLVMLGVGFQRHKKGWRRS